MNKFIIIISLLILTSCGGGSNSSGTLDIKSRDGVWLYTPNGYHINRPLSIYTNNLWLIDRVVYNLNEINYLLSYYVDTRAIQFTLQYGIIPPKNIDIILIDHHTFWCGSISYNNLCEGAYNLKDTIWVGIYTHFMGYSFPDYSALHTQLTVEQMEVWSGTPRRLPFTHHAGVIEDIGCPALLHEWGHVAGISKDLQVEGLKKEHVTISGF